jgi:hypothetical protein
VPSARDVAAEIAEADAVRESRAASSLRHPLVMELRPAPEETAPSGVFVLRLGVSTLALRFR